MIAGDRCDAVLLIIWVPVPLYDIRAIVGDIAYGFNLFVISWVLVRHVVTNLRLSNPLWGEKVEILSCLLPWAALPLRFSTNTLHAHRLMLGLSSGLGWMRFLQDSFKFSSNIGPLVTVVRIETRIV